MPTLDAEPLSLTANSYSTVQEAQDYMDTLVPESMTETWDAAGNDLQSRALMMATRLLDTWFDWFGAVHNPNQPLLWPRLGVIKPGLAEDVSGSVENPWGEPFAVLLNSTTVPLRIKQATAELARQLLAEDRTADSDLETQRLASLTAGPVKLDFRGGVAAKPIPDAVMVICSSLGRVRTRTGSASVTMHRG